MRLPPRSFLAPLALSIALCGCDSPEADGEMYTLYRTSAVEDQSPKFQRTHVATFDAAGGEQYNRENCDIARTLFQAQPGIVVRYWCEKGRYRE